MLDSTGNTTLQLYKRTKEKKRKEKNYQRGIHKLQIPWQGLTYPVIEALATNNTNPRELYTTPNRRWDFDTIRHMAEDYDLFFYSLMVLFFIFTNCQNIFTTELEKKCFLS